MMKLRMRMRKPSMAKKNTYRTRTGPSCCNAGCGAKRHRGVSWRKGTGIGVRAG